MVAFFPHARGSVKQVPGPWRTSAPLQVSVEDLQLQQRAILTQAAIHQAGSYQFLHTLSDQIFVYIFGNRISELMIAGVAFAAPCGSSEPGTVNVFDHYSGHRLSERARPAIVTLGKHTFRSFLTGMSLEIADPELQLSQFTFRFHSFPASR